MALLHLGALREVGAVWDPGRPLVSQGIQAGAGVGLRAGLLAEGLPVAEGDLW